MVKINAKSWHRLSFAAAVVCSAFLLSVGSAWADPTVRVGVQAAPPDEIYLAKEWAEPYGVDIEYTQFSSGGDMLKAFLAGRLDVANGGSARIITLAAKQPEKFYIIATHQWGGDRYGVLVPPDSGADEISDLKEKTIGAVTGSGAYNAFLLYLSEHGLSESDFQIVNMKAEDIASAIESGVIAAGVVWEPYPSIAEASGAAKRIASMKGISKSPVFIVVSREFAKENPDALVRYLAGVIDAGSFMRNKPKEAGAMAAAEISERGVEIDSSALAESFTRFQVGSAVTNELLAELIPMAKNMVSLNKIDSVPDFESLVRREYYEEALSVAKSQA